MLKQNRSNKKIIVIIAVVLLVIGGGSAFALTRGDKTSPSKDKEKVNLAPPTKEDAERVEENKQAVIKRQQDEKQAEQSGANSDSKESVSPTITYADQYQGQVEVGAFVSGVFEDGGTCTATFTNGSANFTKQVQAVRGANSVNCPVMQAPVSSFSPRGTWQVSVSYSSPSSSGTSESKQVEVN